MGDKNVLAGIGQKIAEAVKKEHDRTLEADIGRVAKLKQLEFDERIDERYRIRAVASQDAVRVKLNDKEICTIEVLDDDYQLHPSGDFGGKLVPDEHGAMQQVIDWATAAIIADGEAKSLAKPKGLAGIAGLFPH